MDVVAHGVVRAGTIVAVESDRVEFELGEEIASASPAAITLIVSIFKFDRMEWAIEKCTELGVRRIVPLIARRTESHLAAAANKRLERWNRIARQASEQSRRAEAVDISFPAKLEDALGISADISILLDESENAVHLRDSVEPGRTLALALGPEGGWTSDEVQRFQAAGWKSASLGSTILRAETAAIAATAIAMSMLEARDGF
jgi:16S rRNA (uracil1498-N3)-methyltransferase